MAYGQKSPNDRQDRYRQEGYSPDQPQQWQEGGGHHRPGDWDREESYRRARSEGRVGDRQTEDDIARTAGYSRGALAGTMYGQDSDYGGYGPESGGGARFGTFTDQYGGGDFAAPNRRGFAGYNRPGSDLGTAWSAGPDSGDYRFGRQRTPSGEERWGSRGQATDFTGRGPANYTRSDERIREDACDRLTYDPQVDASNITVSVENGEITLQGTVTDRRAKRRAEDCVEEVTGNRHVQNNLRVGEPGEAAAG